MGRSIRGDRALARPYRDLVWLAYLALPSSGDGERRLVLAHRLVAEALARHPSADGEAYPRLRGEVLRRALRRRALRRRLRGASRLDVVPAVTRGADLAFTAALDRLPAPARAAYALYRMEGLGAAETRAVLASAGVDDPGGALAAVVALESDFGPDSAALHRPSIDPTIARVYGRVPSGNTGRLIVAGAAFALLAAAAMVPVWFDLYGERSPAHGAGPAAADAPVVRQVPRGAWRTTTDLDLGTWEARGALRGDKALVGRALAAWLRPGKVPHRAFHGVPDRAPSADPQLLYAGRLSGVRVVLLRDPGRVARYTETVGGRSLDIFPEPRQSAGEATPLKLLTSRSGSHYLLPPWVEEVHAASLGHRPRWRPVAVAGGVTAAVPHERRSRCWRGPVLRLRAPQIGAGPTSTAIDMGRLTLATLDYRSAASSAPSGLDTAADGFTAWSQLGCAFARPNDEVRSATAWEFFRGALPEGARGRWICVRLADVTGRSTTRAVLLVTSGGHTSPVPTGQRRDTWDCSHLKRDIASGTWWKGPSGQWHYLAAAASGGGIRLRLTTPGAPQRTTAATFTTVPGPMGGDTPIGQVPVSGETAQGHTVPVYQQ
ncbi:hypothetical protein SAMN05421505_10550 [Sinosporangium album]|uniref:DNA-directed RNA polymerase specialized sigma subunit, sigma24 family n=1 Tax=Sinosporangium album TaxID=504805 RepID=A0A1G7UZF3_9ACTN|nr:hypothetical protein [Sinosporangium album]SDG52995.1 hypothetical protein SAMN05421505_10550 [Sinosporangium album]